MSAAPGYWVAVDYMCKAEVIKDSAGRDLAMRQDGASAADMRKMAAAPELIDALRRMCEMHSLLMKKANLAASFLDAETICAMNMAPMAARSALFAAGVEL